MNQSTTESTGTLPTVGFLRLRQILHFIPISRAAWWAGVKRGIYPRPIKLSANTTAWRVDDIRGLIARFDHEPNDQAGDGGYVECGRGVAMPTGIQKKPAGISGEARK